MIFSRLADRFILCPSRLPIPVTHKVRRLVACAGRQVEVWIERGGGGTSNQAQQALEPDVLVLKFNGTGGRAERATLHPLEAWEGLTGEVWSVNPPGYGGSEGRANLASLAAAARAVFDELLTIAGDRPIILTGNSLGTAPALHVAAHFASVPNLAGMLLRNPPPLKELIRGKYGWRTLGLAHRVARHIPPELDSVANAARVRVPCVIHCSGRDRTVPPRFQQLIVDAYAGPKQVVTVAGADHVFVPSPDDTASYVSALNWLRSQTGLGCLASRATAGP